MAGSANSRRRRLAICEAALPSSPSGLLQGGGGCLAGAAAAAACSRQSNAAFGCRSVAGVTPAAGAGAGAIAAVEVALGYAAAAVCRDPTGVRPSPCWREPPRRVPPPTGCPGVPCRGCCAAAGVPRPSAPPPPLSRWWAAECRARQRLLALTRAGATPSGPCVSGHGLQRAAMRQCGQLRCGRRRWRPPICMRRLRRRR